MQRLMLRRLRRSMWRIKLRVAVVLLLIVFASSLTMMLAEYTRNGARVYEDLYDETNLADLIARGYETVPAADLSAACDDLMAATAGTSTPVVGCESRLVVQAQAWNPERGEAGEWIRATIYGFDETASVDATGAISSLWMDPDTSGSTGTVEGQGAIDTHVLNEIATIKEADSVRLRVAGSELNMSITGDGNHPHHMYYLADAATLIPESGTYAVVYMRSSVLAVLAGVPSDARNEWLIDVEGTPGYDLQDTAADEGKELRPLKHEALDALSVNGVEGYDVGDRGAISSVELLRQDLEGSRRSLPFMTVMLAAISGLVIAVSLDRLVRSQRKEIAVLRALGFRGRDIRDSYLIVPVALGALGSIVSIPIAMVLSEAMTSWYFTQFFGIPIVRTNHYPAVLVGFPIAITALVSAFGIFPAITASRLTPLEVMREQGGSVQPQRWLTALTHSLPTTIGVGVRSTFRRPVRLGVTVLGLALALIIIGGSALMISGLQTTFDTAFNETERWDASVVFAPQQEQGIMDWVDNHSSVQTEWYTLLGGNKSGDERQFSVHGMTDFSGGADSMRHFQLVEGALPVAGAATPEVVLDQGSAKFLDWEVGTTATVFLAGEQTDVRLAGTVDELGRSLWMHQSDLEDALGFSLTNGLWIRGEVDDDLRGLAWVVDRDVMIKSFDTAWEQQMAFMGIFYVIGALIGGAVLINTLLLNLAERDAELATLRVLGASHWRLSGVLLVEHAVIGLLGGVAGAALSYVMAVGMAASFTTWSFYFVVVNDWTISFQIIAAVVLAASLTTLVGTRRIRRMNLVEKVKEFAQ